MIWWVSFVVGWLGCGLLIALILGERMAPRTELERRIDDEAQIEALREYNRKAHARLDAIDKLKAKIAGREA